MQARIYLMRWRPTRGRHKGMRHSETVNTFAILKQELSRLRHSGATNIEWACYQKTTSVNQALRAM